MLRCISNKLFELFSVVDTVHCIILCFLRLGFFLNDSRVIKQIGRMFRVLISEAKMSRFSMFVLAIMSIQPFLQNICAGQIRFSFRQIPLLFLCYPVLFVRRQSMDNKCMVSERARSKRLLLSCQNEQTFLSYRFIFFLTFFFLSGVLRFNFFRLLVYGECVFDEFLLLLVFFSLSLSVVFIDVVVAFVF